MSAQARSPSPPSRSNLFRRMDERFDDFEVCFQEKKRRRPTLVTEDPEKVRTLAHWEHEPWPMPRPPEGFIKYQRQQALEEYRKGLKNGSNPVAVQTQHIKTGTSVTAAGTSQLSESRIVTAETNRFPSDKPVAPEAAVTRVSQSIAGKKHHATNVKHKHDKTECLPVIKTDSDGREMPRSTTNVSVCNKTKVMNWEQRGQHADQDIINRLDQSQGIMDQGVNGMGQDQNRIGQDVTGINRSPTRMDQNIREADQKDIKIEQDLNVMAYILEAHKRVILQSHLHGQTEHCPQQTRASELQQTMSAQISTNFDEFKSKEKRLLLLGYLQHKRRDTEIVLNPFQISRGVAAEREHGEDQGGQHRVTRDSIFYAPSPSASPPVRSVLCEETSSGVSTSTDDVLNSPEQPDNESGGVQPTKEQALQNREYLAVSQATPTTDNIQTDGRLVQECGRREDLSVVYDQPLIHQRVRDSLAELSFQTASERGGSGTDSKTQHPSPVIPTGSEVSRPLAPTRPASLPLFHVYQPRSAGSENERRPGRSSAFSRVHWTELLPKEQLRDLHDEHLELMEREFLSDRLLLSELQSPAKTKLISQRREDDGEEDQTGCTKMMECCRFCPSSLLIALRELLRVLVTVSHNKKEKKKAMAAVNRLEVIRDDNVEEKGLAAHTTQLLKDGILDSLLNVLLQNGDPHCVLTAARLFQWMLYARLLHRVPDRWPAVPDVVKALCTAMNNVSEYPVTITTSLRECLSSTLNLLLQSTSTQDMAAVVDSFRGVHLLASVWFTLFDLCPSCDLAAWTSLGHVLHTLARKDLDGFPGLEVSEELAVNWALYHCRWGAGREVKVLPVARILSRMARKESLLDLMMTKQATLPALTDLIRSSGVEVGSCGVRTLAALCQRNPDYITTLLNQEQDLAGLLADLECVIMKPGFKLSVKMDAVFVLKHFLLHQVGRKLIHNRFSVLGEVVVAHVDTELSAALLSCLLEVRQLFNEMELRQCRGLMAEVLKYHLHPVNEKIVLSLTANILLDETIPITKLPPGATNAMWGNLLTRRPGQESSRDTQLLLASLKLLNALLTVCNTSYNSIVKIHYEGFLQLKEGNNFNHLVRLARSSSACPELQRKAAIVVCSLMFEFESPWLPEGAGTAVLPMVVDLLKTSDSQLQRVALVLLHRLLVIEFYTDDLDRALKTEQIPVLVNAITLENEDNLFQQLVMTVLKVVRWKRSDAYSYKADDDIISQCREVFLEKPVQIVIDRVMHSSADITDVSMSKQDVKDREKISRLELTKQISKLKSDDGFHQKIQSLKLRKAKGKTPKAEEIERSLHSSLTDEDTYLDFGFRVLCRSCLVREALKQKKEYVKGHKTPSHIMRYVLLEFKSSTLMGSHPLARRRLCKFVEEQLEKASAENSESSPEEHAHRPDRRDDFNEDDDEDGGSSPAQRGGDQSHQNKEDQVLQGSDEPSREKSRPRPPRSEAPESRDQEVQEAAGESQAEEDDGNMHDTKQKRQKYCPQAFDTDIPDSQFSYEDDEWYEKQNFPHGTKNRTKLSQTKRNSKTGEGEESNKENIPPNQQTVHFSQKTTISQQAYGYCFPIEQQIVDLDIEEQLERNFEHRSIDDVDVKNDLETELVHDISSELDELLSEYLEQRREEQQKQHQEEEDTVQSHAEVAETDESMDISSPRLFGKMEEDSQLSSEVAVDSVKYDHAQCGSDRASNNNSETTVETDDDFLDDESISGKRESHNQETQKTKEREQCLEEKQTGQFLYDGIIIYGGSSISNSSNTGGTQDVSMPSAVLTDESGTNSKVSRMDISNHTSDDDVFFTDEVQVPAVGVKVDAEVASALNTRITQTPFDNREVDPLPDMASEELHAAEKENSIYVETGQLQMTLQQDEPILENSEDQVLVLTNTLPPPITAAKAITSTWCPAAEMLAEENEHTIPYDCRPELQDMDTHKEQVIESSEQDEPVHNDNKKHLSDSDVSPENVLITVNGVIYDLGHRSEISEPMKSERLEEDGGFQYNDREDHMATNKEVDVGVIESQVPQDDRGRRESACLTDDKSSNGRRLIEEASSFHSQTTEDYQYTRAELSSTDGTQQSTQNRQQTKDTLKCESFSLMESSSKVQENKQNVTDIIKTENLSRPLANYDVEAQGTGVSGRNHLTESQVTVDAQKTDTQNAAENRQDKGRTETQTCLRAHDSQAINIKEMERRSTEMDFETSSNIKETELDFQTADNIITTHEEDVQAISEDNCCMGDDTALALNLEKISAQLLSELLSPERNQSQASNTDVAQAEDDVNRPLTVVMEIGNDTLEDIMQAVEEEEYLDIPWGVGGGLEKGSLLGSFQPADDHCKPAAASKEVGQQSARDELQSFDFEEGFYEQLELEEERGCVRDNSQSVRSEAAAFKNDREQNLFGDHITCFETWQGTCELQESSGLIEHGSLRDIIQLSEPIGYVHEPTGFCKQLNLNSSATECLSSDSEKDVYGSVGAKETGSEGLEEKRHLCSIKENLPDIATGKCVDCTAEQILCRFQSESLDAEEPTDTLTNLDTGEAMEGFHDILTEKDMQESTTSAVSLQECKTSVTKENDDGATSAAISKNGTADVVDVNKDKLTDAAAVTEIHANSDVPQRLEGLTVEEVAEDRRLSIDTVSSTQDESVLLSSEVSNNSPETSGGKDTLPDAQQRENAQVTTAQTDMHHSRKPVKRQGSKGKRKSKLPVSSPHTAPSANTNNHVEDKTKSALPQPKISQAKHDEMSAAEETNKIMEQRKRRQQSLPEQQGKKYERRMSSSRQIEKADKLTSEADSTRESPNASSLSDKTTTLHQPMKMEHVVQPTGSGSNQKQTPTISGVSTSTTQEEENKLTCSAEALLRGNCHSTSTKQVDSEHQFHTFGHDGKQHSISDTSISGKSNSMCISDIKVQNTTIPDSSASDMETGKENHLAISETQETRNKHSSTSEIVTKQSRSVSISQVEKVDKRPCPSETQEKEDKKPYTNEKGDHQLGVSERQDEQHSTVKTENKNDKRPSRSEIRSTARLRSNSATQKRDKRSSTSHKQKQQKKQATLLTDQTKSQRISSLDKRQERPAQNSNAPEAKQNMKASLSASDNEEKQSNSTASTSGTRDAHFKHPNVMNKHGQYRRASSARVTSKTNKCPSTSHSPQKRGCHLATSKISTDTHSTQQQNGVINGTSDEHVTVNKDIDADAGIKPRKRSDTDGKGSKKQWKTSWQSKNEKSQAGTGPIETQTGATVTRVNGNQEMKKSENNEDMFNDSSLSLSKYLIRDETHSENLVSLSKNRMHHKPSQSSIDSEQGDHEEDCLEALQPCQMDRNADQPFDKGSGATISEADEEIRHLTDLTKHGIESLIRERTGKEVKFGEFSIQELLASLSDKDSSIENQTPESVWENIDLDESKEFCKEGQQNSKEKPFCNSLQDDSSLQDITDMLPGGQPLDVKQDVALMKENAGDDTDDNISRCTPSDQSKGSDVSDTAKSSKVKGTRMEPAVNKTLAETTEEPSDSCNTDKLYATGCEPEEEEELLKNAKPTQQEQSKRRGKKIVLSLQNPNPENGVPTAEENAVPLESENKAEIVPKRRHRVKVRRDFEGGDEIKYSIPQSKIPQKKSSFKMLRKKKPKKGNSDEDTDYCTSDSGSMISVESEDSRDEEKTSSRKQKSSSSTLVKLKRAFKYDTRKKREIGSPTASPMEKDEEQVDTPSNEEQDDIFDEKMDGTSSEKDSTPTKSSEKVKEESPMALWRQRLLDCLRLEERKKSESDVPFLDLTSDRNPENNNSSMPEKVPDAPGNGTGSAENSCTNDYDNDVFGDNAPSQQCDRQQISNIPHNKKEEGTEPLSGPEDFDSRQLTEQSKAGDGKGTKPGEELPMPKGKVTGSGNKIPKLNTSSDFEFSSISTEDNPPENESYKQDSKRLEKAPTQTSEESFRAERSTETLAKKRSIFSRFFKVT